MEIARLYREAQNSFVELVADLDSDQWATTVGCTPEWTISDVLSHVAGVAIDIVDGRIEGAGTDPWTAAQVERWRGTDPAEMIERWNKALGPAAEMAAAGNQARVVFDCHTHEQDVRGALGRPGNRDSEAAQALMHGFASIPADRSIAVERTDGPALLVPGSSAAAGTDADLVLAGVTGFEFARSRLGRRSADQVRGWDWSERPTDALLNSWFVFGPAAQAVDE